MEKRFYQMKDLIDKFHISRDTIKYYEKKGLISSVRNDTGYRLYDEVNMQKLRKIRNLKDIGFSLNAVDTQGTEKGISYSKNEIEKIREEIEQQIIELNSRLDKLSVYEQWIFENKMYRDMFKITRDFKLCIECKNVIDSCSECFFVRDLLMLELSQENDIINMEEKEAVLSKASVRINRECEKCTSDKILTFPKAYRGTWCYTGREDLQKLIYDAYERAQDLGYELCKTVYCIKKVADKDGKECVLLDVIIPLED